MSRTERRGRPGLARLVRQVHGGGAGGGGTADMTDYNAIVVGGGAANTRLRRGLHAGSAVPLLSGK